MLYRIILRLPLISLSILTDNAPGVRPGLTLGVSNRVHIQANSDFGRVTEPNWSPSDWHLGYTDQSQIRYLVIFDNMTELNIVAGRFFAINTRLENYRYQFRRIHHMPICQDIAVCIN